jgi:hypothetical protein
MSELQKIAIGLLSMSHPETHRFRNPDLFSRTPGLPEPAQSSTQVTPAVSALRGLKFAIAALFAGARAIPLGDNSRVTRELGEYGARLNGC